MAVGQVVRVKDTVTSEYKEYAGQTVTIKRILDDMVEALAQDDALLYLFLYEVDEEVRA